MKMDLSFKKRSAPARATDGETSLAEIHIDMVIASGFSFDHEVYAFCFGPAPTERQDPLGPKLVFDETGDENLAYALFSK